MRSAVVGAAAVMTGRVVAAPIRTFKAFSESLPQNPVVVAPDAGAAKRAKKFADLVGANLAIMHKSRPMHSKAEILHVVGQFIDNVVEANIYVAGVGGSLGCGVRTYVEADDDGP